MLVIQIKTLPPARPDKVKLHLNGQLIPLSAADSEGNWHWQGELPGPLLLEVRIEGKRRIYLYLQFRGRRVLRKEFHCEAPEWDFRLSGIPLLQ